MLYNFYCIIKISALLRSLTEDWIESGVSVSSSVQVHLVNHNLLPSTLNLKSDIVNWNVCQYLCGRGIPCKSPSQCDALRFLKLELNCEFIGNYLTGRHIDPVTHHQPTCAQQNAGSDSPLLVLLIHHQNFCTPHPIRFEDLHYNTIIMGNFIVESAYPFNEVAEGQQITT